MVLGEPGRRFLWHKIYLFALLGRLIGVTTPTKDGLMPKNQVCRNIAKINNLHCRLKCNISSPGEWVNGFLYVGSTSGSVSTIAVSVMIWNETKVFCKLINGVKGYISSISYIQETNSISLSKSEYLDCNRLIHEIILRTKVEICSKISIYLSHWLLW